MVSHKKRKFSLILLGLLLFTLVSSFQISHTLAQSTVGYAFQESSFIDWTNPIANTTLNIRNQTTFTGNYTGTYTWKDDTIGNFPENWTDLSTGTTEVTVISDHAGHDTVLDFDDDDASGMSYMRKDFDDEDYGTVEWYMMTTNTNYEFYVFWTGAGLQQYFTGFRSGAIQVGSGSGYVTIDASPNNNQWYHVRVDFRCTGAPAYMGLSEHYAHVYLDGKHYGDYNFYGSRTAPMSAQLMRTEGSDANYHAYLDGLNWSWNNTQDIGENIIPYYYESTTQEIDRWEFFNNENGTATDHEQEEIPFWDELLTSGYIQKDKEDFEDECAVYFDITDNDHDGLERSIDVNSGTVRQINFSISYDLIFLGVQKVYTTFDIDSYDDTLICRLRIDDDTSQGDLRLSYYDGSSYVEIEDIVQLGVLSLGITIVNNVVVCDTGAGIYAFQILSEGKTGIGDIKIESYKVSSDDSFMLWIDSIGVYIDGVSESDDYGNSLFNITDDFDQREFFFFNINATGMFSCNMISYDFGITNYKFFDYQNASYINQINIYDDFVNVITNSLLMVSTNTSYTINTISLKGISLYDGSNNYVPVITHSNINHSNNYFWVDSSNRLRFSLTANDNETEHIEINFDVPDRQTENYSVSFYSNMDGSSLAFFRVMYTDDTSSFIPFPTHLTTTNMIIPQTRELESIGVLITDNDLTDNDQAYGFISSLQLIWYLDLGVSVITLNLMMVIVPIMVILVPTFGISARYGKNTILPVFILMSIICFATQLIPTWLFFIIMLSSGAFLFMKRKRGSED